jgi:hypothetical protein
MWWVRVLHIWYSSSTLPFHYAVLVLEYYCGRYVLTIAVQDIHNLVAYYYLVPYAYRALTYLFCTLYSPTTVLEYLG